MSWSASEGGKPAWRKRFAPREEQIRDLRNQIENAGGDRLRQIPVLIAKEHAFALTKRAANDRYHDALAKMGYGRSGCRRIKFVAVQTGLPALRTEWEAATAQLNTDHEQRILERAEIRQDLMGLPPGIGRSQSAT